MATEMANELDRERTEVGKRSPQAVVEGDIELHRVVRGPLQADDH